MKLNLTLFLVLIGLLTITYFWEERGVKDQLLIQNSDRVLKISLDQIDAFNIGDNFFIRSNNSWRLKSSPIILNDSSVQKFLALASSLVVKKYNPDSFEQKGDSFGMVIGDKEFDIKIGDINLVTGDFRFNSNGTTSLGMLSNGYDGIYKNDIDLKIKRYSLLMSILRSPIISLAQRNLNKLYNLSQASIVKFTSSVYGNFILNLKENTKLPRTFEEIPLLNLQNSIKIIFENITILDILKVNDFTFKDYLGKWIFDDELTLQIFKRKDDFVGLYLVDWDRGQVYVLDPKDQDKLIINHQAFLLKQHKVNVNTSINAKLNTYEFKIEDLEAFNYIVDSKNYKIKNPQLLNVLFNVIFNTGDFKSAYYVTTADKSIYENRPLRLMINSRVFYVSFVANLVKVYDVHLKSDFIYLFRNNLVKIDKAEDIFLTL